jgi:hypothetical protein
LRNDFHDKHQLGVFDNRKDADFLMSVQGRKELAEITVEWIKQIEAL